MLLVGNSYASSMMHGAVEALHGNYSYFHFFQIPSMPHFDWKSLHNFWLGCLPITEWTKLLLGINAFEDSYEVCYSYGEAVTELVKQLKPQLLIVSFR